MTKEEIAKRLSNLTRPVTTHVKVRDVDICRAIDMHPKTVANLRKNIGSPSKRTIRRITEYLEGLDNG
jgi:hypothetical protein